MSKHTKPTTNNVDYGFSAKKQNKTKKTHKNTHKKTLGRELRSCGAQRSGMGTGGAHPAPVLCSGFPPRLPPRKDMWARGTHSAGMQRAQNGGAKGGRDLLGRILVPWTRPALHSGPKLAEKAPADCSAGPGLQTLAPRLPTNAPPHACAASEAALASM